MHAAALVATLGFVLTSSVTIFIAAANSIATPSTNAFTFAVFANNDIALVGRIALIDVGALAVLPGRCYGTKMDEMCQVSVMASMTRVAVGWWVDGVE